MSKDRSPKDLRNLAHWMQVDLQLSVAEGEQRYLKKMAAGAVVFEFPAFLAASSGEVDITGEYGATTDSSLRLSIEMTEDGIQVTIFADSDVLAQQLRNQSAQLASRAGGRIGPVFSFDSIARAIVVLHDGPEVRQQLAEGPILNLDVS